MVEGGGCWPQFSSGVALERGCNSGLRSCSCIRPGQRRKYIVTFCYGLTREEKRLNGKRLRGCMCRQMTTKKTKASFMIFNICAAVWDKLGWAKSCHALSKYTSEC